MARSVLQKSADSKDYDKLPHEVLNPLNAGKQYGVQLYQPSSELIDLVEHYWIIRWDLRDQPSFIVEVIPSPYINMTFMHEGPCITGVTTGKYVYKLQDSGRIVGVKFKPGGFYYFWRQDVSQLTDNKIPASDVFAKANKSFNAAMLSLKTDDDTVSNLETLLLERQPVNDKNLALIKDVLEFVTNNDNPTIHLIAKVFNTSERTLQELFKTHVGVGLKWIVLRARIQEAAKLATKLEKPDWVTIATELGYSDQSHFVNDFKKIIGKSPAQYRLATKVKSSLKKL